MRDPSPWAAVIALALAALPAETRALTLSRDGRTTLHVVIADHPTPAERTAAEELVSYLQRVTSATFPIVSEAHAAADEPAIWVGPTEKARRMGYDAERMGPEDWRIHAEGADLLLLGGRPRGTLYAVYHFLEDQVGVRWWTPFEEHVPVRRDLAVDVIRAGRPAFAYRDVQGVRGPRAFHARNRANGHFSFLTRTHGGNEGYGPPSMVHTFFQYVPPDEYFAEHPEYFAERDGVRVGERTQLCLTSDAVVQLVASKLLAYIEQARDEAEMRGERPPRLFDVSQNDWSRPCTCESCSRLDAREGGHSGTLVTFVNRLADKVAGRYPDVLLDTIAYQYTFGPPRHLRTRDNVVVRLAALYDRDFLRPVTHRKNRAVRRAIERWSERTRHLRIWAYTVTFGYEANNFPLPNLGVIADDFRFYREQGVEGLFVQHGHAILSDMRDLKLWVVFKLAEDPTRDVDSLVCEFTSGFYGPAGGTIREYLRRLEHAARASRASIRFPADSAQYDYLTPEFLRGAQSLFDRADREVGDDATLRRRLRHARLSLDRATLWRWDEQLGSPAGKGDAGGAIDPRAVAERYRAAANEQIAIRIPEEDRRRHRERVDDEISTLLRRIER